MQTVEATGASIDEARKSAAKQLGVPESALEVTVLEESKGLFGRGSVRIRAEAQAVEAAAEKPAKPAAKARATKAAKPAPEPEPEPEPVVEAEAEPVEEKKPRRSSRAKKTEEPAPDKAVVSAGDSRDDKADVVATAKDGKALLALVDDFLDAAGLDVTAKVAELQGRYVNIELDGKDLAHLIGKHGEVLNAAQYLTNIIAARRFENGVRVVLDGGSYRRKREEALTGLATKIAEQVVARGEEAVLDALPAFERRIVHKALGEMAGITTYSEGEEPNRRVVIAPAE